MSAFESQADVGPRDRIGLLSAGSFAKGATAALVYDGDCPLCAHFAKALRIRRDIGKLALINARTNPDTVRQLGRLGAKLDEGMVLILKDRIYHGAAALTVLASLSTRATAFNRMAFRIFSSPHRARAFYPVLKLVRTILLRAMQKKSISNAM